MRTGYALNENLAMDALCIEIQPRNEKRGFFEFCNKSAPASSAKQETKEAWDDFKSARGIYDGNMHTKNAWARMRLPGDIIHGKAEQENRYLEIICGVDADENQSEIPKKCTDFRKHTGFVSTNVN